MVFKFLSNRKFFFLTYANFAHFFSVVDEKPYHLNTLTSVRLVSGKMLMESVRWKVDSVKCKVGGIFIITRMRDTYIFLFLYILIQKMILKK